MSLFVARSLPALATHFRSMAEVSDRRAKTATTKTARLDAEAAARTWREAAFVIEQTTIVPEDKRTEADKDYDMDRYGQR